MSGQSRRASVIESAVNMVAGYGIGVAMQALIFQHYGLPVPVSHNLIIALMFAAASMLRSYGIRRAFEAWRAAS